MPDDGIYVEDLTQVGYVGRLAFPVYQPRTYIHSGYQGTLGYRYATALGAKVARPDLPVVSISGDGGFMYNVQELSTAALHGIDVVAIVFADGAYGNVRRMQKNDYGNKLIGVDLLNPNFPKMADSYGIAGVRATSPERIAPRAGRRLEAARAEPDRGAGRRDARPLADPDHAAHARRAMIWIDAVNASPFPSLTRWAAWERVDAALSGGRVRVFARKSKRLDMAAVLERTRHKQGWLGAELDRASALLGFHPGASAPRSTS